MEENTPNKIGTFLSSAANRVLNLIMILVIIGLAALVAWFWHQNELLKNDIKNLEEKITDFDKMVVENEVKKDDNNVVAKQEVEIKESVDDVVETNNTATEMVEVKNNETNSSNNKDVTETANWKTYKNEKYGFEIKYPENWKVETHKTYSQSPSLGGVDCNKTPDICKFEMTLFTNNKTGKEYRFFEVRENKDAIKSYDSVVKNSSLKKDMIDGCLITYSVSSNNKGFLIHTFLPSDFIENETERNQFNKKCENNELEGEIDMAVKTFKVY